MFLYFWNNAAGIWEKLLFDKSLQSELKEKVNKCTLQNTINIYQKTKVKPEGPKISGSGWPPQDYREYRKSPKISSGAYTFQRPLLRGLFLERLMYGGKFAFQNQLG